MLSTQFDSIPMTDQGAASEKGMRGQARPLVSSWSPDQLQELVARSGRLAKGAQHH